MLKRVFPRASFTLNDLSPHYLEFAKRKETLKGANFIECEGQALSELEAESFDCAFHIFLFHELPKEERQKVIDEQVRLTKPGGLIIICDSLQIADRPEWKEVLEDFPKRYHEPFYRDYIKHDLERELEERGLEIVHKEQVLLTKALVARKK